MPDRNDMPILAWSGWRMNVPDRWRPLRIEGNWDAGRMMIGDTGRALLQVKWTRPRSRRFDPDHWLGRKLRKLGRRDTNLKPENDRFAVSAFVPSGRQDNADPRAIWYGYAPRGNLAIELVANTADSPRYKLQLTRDIVPSLESQSAESPTQWALFGSSFRAPGGFYYRRCDLKLGDMSLEFIDRRRRRLLLRQIYPAQLALSRRNLIAWMSRPPFAGRRRNRTIDVEERARDAGEGQLRRAWLKIAWPLGFVLPRWSLGLGIVDQNLDRLLLAEMVADDPDALCETTLCESIDAMNWAQGKESAA